MVFYIVATLFVFLLSYWAYTTDPVKYADLVGVSVALSVACVVANLLLELFHFPDALLTAPIIDLTLATMIYRAWLKNREVWKVVMVGTLVSQLVMHVVMIGLWKTGGLTQLGLYQYVVAVNGVFIVQLLTLGWVGAGHGLDYLRHWLSDRGRLHPVLNGRK